MDLALLTIDTKRVSSLSDLNGVAALYVGSRLYIVLTWVTLWSVTNPLTLFKIRTHFGMCYRQGNVPPRLSRNIPDETVDCSWAWLAAINVPLGQLGKHGVMSQGDDGSFFLSHVDNGDQSLSRL